MASEIQQDSDGRVRAIRAHVRDSARLARFRSSFLEATNLRTAGLSEFLLRR